MKKIFLGIIIISIIGVSCHNSKQNNLKTNHVEFGQLKLFNKSFQSINNFRFKKNSNKKQNRSNYIFNNYSEFSNTSFNDLIDVLSVKFPIFSGIDNELSIIMYSKNNNFDYVDSIDCISVLFYSNNQMNHKFYRIVNNNVTEVTGLSVETDLVSLLDLDFLSEAFLNVNNCGWFHVSNYEPPFQTYPISTTYPKRNVTKWLIDNNLGKPKEDGCKSTDDNGTACQASKEACSYDANVGYTCGSSCSVSQLINIGTSENEDITGINTASIYNFRDSFLVNYAIGRKYISYFYLISGYENVFHNINSNTIADQISFALDVMAVADSLQNGSNSSIIITSAFKSRAIGIIHGYKQSSNNTEYLAIFNDIIYDISRFEGLTKGQILALVS